jgi:hypothetical protein
MSMIVQFAGRIADGKITCALPATRRHPERSLGYFQRHDGGVWIFWPARTGEMKVPELLQVGRYGQMLSEMEATT